MTGPTFDTVADALEGLYGEVGSHVVVDRAAGEVTVGPPGVSVEDLASFFDRLVGEPDFVPGWIPHDLALVALHLRRDPVTTAFDLALTVEASHLHWEVFDGFAIEGASLQVAHTAAGLWGRVAGTARFDGLVLDVAVVLPDEYVTAHLHQVDDAAAFLAGNGLVAAPTTSRPPTETAQLQDLSLYGAIRAHRFVLHVEATHLLDVAPFDLRRCAADVQLGGDSRVTLWVDLDVKLGPGEPVAIDLVGNVHAEGWSFVGDVVLDDGMTLGELAADVATLLEADGTPDLPPVLADCSVLSLSLSLDTAARDLSFTCHLHWDHDDVDAVVHLDHADGNLTARGTLTVGKLAFDLVLDHGSDTTAVIGVFAVDGGVQVTLADVMDALGAADDTLGDLPEGFSFGILDAVVAHASGSRVLLAADMDVGVDLSGLGSLPVIGAMLPPDDAMTLRFRPLVSSTWPAPELALVQQAMPAGVPPLPDTIDHAGARIDARLHLGGDRTIELPLLDVPTAGADPDSGTPDASPASTTSPTTSADADPDAVAWHPVDKAFGPLHVSQVGVHVDRAQRRVEVLLGGSVAIAGLELSLMGLGASYALDDHTLAFSLQGLGLDLRRPPLEVAGAFLQRDGELVGKAMIRTATFGLTALGAFGTVGGSPSMFLYGVLDTPIGGPPFFFVDGLAVGLGVNRAFVPPAVDAVRRFPLVSDAAGSTTAPTSLDDQLGRLHQAVPPALGEYFVAIGVKFTSFKLLESFVLLVVSFGEHVEVDLLGTSTYQTPPGDLGPIPPMARVDLELVGRIAPAEGVVSVQAQLSPTSYVYNPLCHVSGGFAFASWFGGPHAGDFVLSVGGYHPHYHPPAHYPTPPRVAIAYQVTPDVHVKGEGYFALTPSVFMAGAALEASAKAGAATASFRMSVDFLIGWEPYHYDITLQVAVAARWHWFHTSASVRLHLWGPDFTGRAVVTWTVFSFDVTFGSGGSTGPVPIGFERFREAFLPDPDTALGIRVAAGLVDTVTTSAGDVWTIDPANLRLETTSIVPSGAGLGIAPMGVSSLTGTDQVITITRDGQPVTEEFTIVDVPETSFPSALWGTSVERDLHDPPARGVAGRSITPATPPAPTETVAMRRRDLEGGGGAERPTLATNHWSVAYLPHVDEPITDQDGASVTADGVVAPSPFVGIGGVGARDLPWDRIQVRDARGRMG